MLYVSQLRLEYVVVVSKEKALLVVLLHVVFVCSRHMSHIARSSMVYHANPQVVHAVLANASVPSISSPSK